jgi:hypothetical protein
MKKPVKKKKLVVNKRKVTSNKQKAKIKLHFKNDNVPTKKKKIEPPKMGRPTKYDPSFVAKVDEYLLQCGREQTMLPTLEQFTIFLNISMDALEDYREKYADFSGALEKIMKCQKIQLINDGIYGGKEVNSTIVKLLLQNNHGMREKVDTTTDGKPLPIQVVSYKDL